MEGAEEDHQPPEGVAVREVVVQKGDVPPLIEGAPLIVTTAVDTPAVPVKVIVLVPADTPVRTPVVYPIVATEVVLLVQVPTDIPADVLSVIVMELPTHVENGPTMVAKEDCDRNRAIRANARVKSRFIKKILKFVFWFFCVQYMT
jgi:hypothetical protein